LLLDFQKRYGPVTGFTIGPYPRALICCSDGFETIMSNATYINKGTQIYPIVVPWLGEGLITSNGAKWHFRRKLLTPTFHFKILQDFVAVMNEQARVLVNDVLLKLDLSKPVNVVPLVCRASLDIICEAAMGKNMGVQLNPDSAYPSALLKISDLIVVRCVR
jgi:cytochrome P450 family 4 subfamily V